MRSVAENFVYLLDSFGLGHTYATDLNGTIYTLPIKTTHTIIMYLFMFAFVPYVWTNLQDLIYMHFTYLRFFFVNVRVCNFL